MKNWFITLLLLFALKNTTSGQYVNIADPNFALWLQTNHPNCMNGTQMDTTCTSLTNQLSIFVNQISISDLNGVQYFPNLNSLTCTSCGLINLPNLQNSLTYLNIADNPINNINSLPQNLTFFNCSDCNFNNLPTLPNSIDTLICSNNNLSSLPVLPNTITYLNCSANNLSMLPNLPNSILWLSCAANQLTYLPTLPTNLLELQCQINNLNTLPSLPALLFNLNCFNNILNNLPSMPSGLKYLACYNNQLTSIPNLPNSILALSCFNNQLTNLPVLPNSIQNLACGNNQLTSLQTLPNTMFSLNISGNYITCLSNLPQVNSAIYGNISNNPLTCVPNQTNYSLGLPLCMDNDPVNNPNYCAGVANITGYVYKDLDTNCNYNNIDWPTQNIPVKLYDGQNNMLAMSYTVNGAYSFTLLQPDTFVVKIDDVALPFSMDCSQANNQIAPLDSANQTIQNINFPVVCDTAYDIKVNSVNSQGWVFPGQQHYLNINISDNMSWYNLNCSSINYSGTVSINITGPVTYNAPTNNALTPAVNGNTFTYNITDFSTLTPSSFGLQFITDTTAQANDQICVHVEINPTPLDADTTNNVYDFCYQVVNSYDPNMKEVYPVNVLPAYDDWFTYTIHFQNTGNAPAFNIRLRDTLDANLDINTFEIRGYSHPAIVSINGNILTVRFNNIMLPDSTTDYEGSMGYFQYRMKPLPNLPLGTQIENTAYIYFDYNAPIITNTTQNNFQMVKDLKSIDAKESNFVIYPNPSSGIYFFKDNRNLQSIEVYNMMGELILSQGNAKQINLQAFPKGIYVARINGAYVKRLVKE